MKALLLTVALLIIGVALVLELRDRYPGSIDLGFFIFATGCVLAAALWKDPGRQTKHCEYCFQIYTLLSESPLSLSELNTQLNKEMFDSNSPEMAKEAIVRMMQEGYLELHGDVVHLANNPTANKTVAETDIVPRDTP